MKSISKSSFSGLVDYISSDQKNEHRIENINITNVPEIEGYDDLREAALAAGELGDFTQDQNKRSKDDKTYHLLVSFRAGEHPAPQVLKEIEQAYADALGFGEHQRVSAVHADTDNLHIHIAFNKIHPTNFTIKTPHNDNWTLDQIRESLEEKYGLERDNHIKDKQQAKTQSQSKAADMEAHTGQQSFLSWMDENLKESLKKADNWQSVYELLSDHGVTLKKRGNGFIFEAESGVRLKASSLDRDFSKRKLEKRLGAFEEISVLPVDNNARTLNESANIGQEEAEKVGQSEKAPDPQSAASPNQAQNLGAGSASQNSNSSSSAQGKAGVKPQKTYQKKPIPIHVQTAQLYAEYKKEADACKLEKTALLKEQRERIAKVRELNKLAREILKNKKKVRGSKKAQYALLRNKQVTDIEEIKEEIQGKIKKLGSGGLSWADWLKKEAETGNETALEALRGRKSSLIKKAERYAADPAIQSKTGLAQRKDVYLTKNGTLLVKVGAETIRDDGKHLTLSQKTSDEALLFAITAAAKRDGSTLTLTGSKDFQERIAKLAAKEGLEVSFADKKLEKIRQAVIQKQEKENDRRRAEAENIRGVNGRNERNSGGRRGAGSRRKGLGSAGRSARANVTVRRAFRSFAHRITEYAFGFYGGDRNRISKSGFSEPWNTSFTTAGRNSMRDVSKRNVADNQKPENQTDPRSAVSLPLSENRRVGAGSGREARNDGVRRQGKLDQNLAQATERGGRVLNKKSAADFLEEKTPFQKYLAERQEKKDRGIIKETYLPMKEETGIFAYEGIRKKDGQSMVLLNGKEADKVFVLEIDKKTENRLRQIKKGQKVEVQGGQKIITRPIKSKLKNKDNEGR